MEGDAPPADDCGEHVRITGTPPGALGSRARTTHAGRHDAHGLSFPKPIVWAEGQEWK